MYIGAWCIDILYIGPCGIDTADRSADLFPGFRTTANLIIETFKQVKGCRMLLIMLMV